MIFVENIDSESSDHHPIASQSKKEQYWEDLSSIEQFLDAKVFEKKLEKEESTQNNPQNIRVQPTEEGSSEDGNHETEVHSTQKSIFHNFQKHLITLLRKVINISTDSKNQHSKQHLALLLWNAFKKVPSYNKQTLHMIFGVSNFNSFEVQLQKIASKYKDCRPLWHKYSPDQIFEAQAYIRKEVVQQMKKLNKNGIRLCCNVRKFETFYQYFESFLFELSEGPISSRMSKTRKLIVLQKITNKTLTNDQ